MGRLLVLYFAPVIVRFCKKCLEVRPVVYERVSAFSPRLALIFEYACAENKSVSGVDYLFRRIRGVRMGSVIYRVLDLTDKVLKSWLGSHGAVIFWLFLIRSDGEIFV